MLARLFIVSNHPQHAGIPGTTYVYLQDTSVAGLQGTWKREKEREVPSGNLQELLTNGYIQLCEGDSVFSRSEQGSQNPNEDMIQVRMITAAMNNAFNKAQDDFLGPRAMREHTHPKYPTNLKGNRMCGPPIGGIALERSKAGPAITAAAFSEAPPIVCKRTCKMAPLINLPLIGIHDNYAYATCQANVTSVTHPAMSSTKKEQKAKGPDLTDNMGFFSGTHFDLKDDVGHFSHMSANSNLPGGEEYTPGFFILELAIASEIIDKVWDYRGIKGALQDLEGPKGVPTISFNWPKILATPIFSLMLGNAKQRGVHYPTGNASRRVSSFDQFIVESTKPQRKCTWIDEQTENQEQAAQRSEVNSKKLAVLYWLLYLTQIQVQSISTNFMKVSRLSTPEYLTGTLTFGGLDVGREQQQLADLTGDNFSNDEFFVLVVAYSERRAMSGHQDAARILKLSGIASKPHGRGSGALGFSMGNITVTNDAAVCSLRKMVLTA
ncbi:hypothetical protein B0H17DRAFT_1141775 [Mycena rosella]|uniref:Uncharacterized protein n=1 Tax=Mycena rosella TaxID=1033263 RepID=A0AAD7CYW7_MYCRO|nr:hypothetical protein B0H17DRAFT_1141775 [Mycena rosella]